MLEEDLSNDSITDLEPGTAPQNVSTSLNALASPNMDAYPSSSRSRLEGKRTSLSFYSCVLPYSIDGTLPKEPIAQLEGAHSHFRKDKKKKKKSKEVKVWDLYKRKTSSIKGSSILEVRNDSIKNSFCQTAAYP